ADARELPELTIHTRDEGDSTVGTVRGDLDLTTDRQLRCALRSALLRSPHGIELDLGGVGFCDCSGLNTLLNTRQQALEDAKTVTIRHAGPALHRILEITGALPLFAPDSVPAVGRGRSGCRRAQARLSDGPRGYPWHMIPSRVEEVLPELAPFVHAVQARRPDDGTWCEAWTVRDVLVHQTGNAEELARVLQAFLDGTPVQTRSFDREAPYRRLSDTELWNAFLNRCERLTEVTEAAARDLPPDTEVMWTGRSVTAPFFAEHMREELILHRWDLTGDDRTAVEALTEPWMTEHSVVSVGRPLLERGRTGLDLGPEGRVEGRLRTPGMDDVVVTADADSCGIRLAAPEGPATIESDAAVRVLLLWGRRPADPSGWHSSAGPDDLRRVRALLGGY
ncbi:STAS domain-containing protein, partial [Streptomyces sp. NPDC059627]